MKRREAIKGITALGALALLPKNVLFAGDSHKNVHFIGIGHTGYGALEYMIKKGAKGQFTYITSSKKNASAGIEAIHSPELVLSVDVKSILKRNSNYVIITELNGSAGTVLVKNLSEYLQKNSKKFAVICSLPFRFEGKLNKSLAEKTKRELERSVNLKCCDPEEIRKKYGRLSLSSAFEKTNEELYRLWQSA